MVFANADQKFESSKKAKLMRQLIFLLAVCCMLTTASAQSTDNDGVLRFLAEDYVAGLIARPARVFECKAITTLLEVADDTTIIDEAMEEIRSGVGFDPREVQEFAVLLDRKTLFSMARISEDGEPAPANTAMLLNRLKQVGLAMHNFHDVYNRFPDHDGRDGDDNKGKLSWRVHLLPFLNHAALYNQFKLDEAWDSDTNKALIEKMPDVFKTPGVEDKGKSSLHGIVGKGTIFNGDGGVGMQNITDGTSNTIMVVIAGADKADTWTKPGGVQFKEGEASETLGKIGETFLMTRCDGSAQVLPADMDADTFRRLVSCNDGEFLGDISSAKRPPERLPTWIVKYRTKVNMSAVLAALKPMGDPVKVDVSGVTTYTFGEYVLALPNQNTLIAAPSDLLPKVLKSTKAAGKFGTALAEASADKDLAVAIDLTDLKPFKDRMAGNVPMAGIVQNVRSISVAMDLSGKGPDIQEITATTENEATAVQLTALLNGLLQAQKYQMMALGQNPNVDVPQGLIDAGNQLIELTEIAADGTDVSYRMKKPKDPDAFIDSLRPAMEQLFEAGKVAQARAKRSRATRSLKMIGLAFHNYHDVYRSFPRYDGDARPDPDDAKRGLSWRVHLLPFLENAKLYEEFNLNEPWDSDTNKPLIEKMPDVFKTAGVDKPGHTAIHVFIGAGAPFNDGERLTRLRDFLDGTSNTILATEAGPDTAEIWTKPSGLKFTGKDSLKLFGNVGEKIKVVFADGAVRYVPRDIDAETLNNLIQGDDGNPVNFEAPLE